MDMNSRPGDADELAIQRYRYLLRTAPPEDLEAAHREAFEQLTPEQRHQVLQGLTREVAPNELRNADDSADGLARLATRAELRRPGTMERAFGGQQAGAGGLFGGGFGGSFLGMLAGAFVGTSIANAILPMDVSAAEGGAEGTGGDAGLGDDGGRVEGGDWDGGGEDLGGFGDGGGFDLGDIGF
jgi:hypothetical protein